MDVKGMCGDEVSLAVKIMMADQRLGAGIGSRPMKMG
jgi:hypothetical protein